MDSLQFAPRHRQVARLFRPAREHHRVVLLDELVAGQIDADMGAVMKLDAFGRHLLDAALDVDLLHLEVGDAVAQQAAGLGPALIDMHVVAGARELLRASKPCRP